MVETIYAKTGKVYTNVIGRFSTEWLAKEYAEDRTSQEGEMYAKFGDDDPYFQSRFDVEYEGE